MRQDMVMALWRARSRREQFLLAGLAIAVLLFFAWYGIASPLRRVAADAQADHARAMTELAEVESAVAEIAAVQGLAAVPADGLAEAVEASAAASGIALSRNRVDNAREITVWADAVEPAALFHWIETLQQAHGVTVANLTAARNEDGALNVETRLARGGS